MPLILEHTHFLALCQIRVTLSHSLAHLRQMETGPITVIGVYLGHSDSDQEKLEQLFRWLTVTTGEELSDRLGDLLQALL